MRGKGQSLKMKRRRVFLRKNGIPSWMPDKPLCVRYDELLHLRKAVEVAEAKVPQNPESRPSGRTIHR